MLMSIAVEIIKNHAKCMQRILHLLKNLNERQLFMNYISLTPSKRQYRQKKGNIFPFTYLIFFSASKECKGNNQRSESKLLQNQCTIFGVF